MKQPKHAKSGMVGYKPVTGSWHELAGKLKDMWDEKSKQGNSIKDLIETLKEKK